MIKKRKYILKTNLYRKTNIRLKVLAVLSILVFSFLTFRAFQIQIIRGKGFESKARSLHKKNILIHPRRGNIYDKKLRELALTVKAPSIYLRPKVVKDKQKVIRFLTEYLGFSRKKSMKMLENKSSFIWVKRYAEEKEGKLVAESKIKGLGVIKEYKRVYPLGELASHILGFAGVDTKGLEGIELKYDRILQKKPVEISVEQDGRMVKIFSDVDEYLKSSRGNSIVLTIDSKVQLYLEEELKKVCVKQKAKACMGIFTNPSSGEIIAASIYPSFNPNEFTKYSPERWRNRIVTDIIEPGSTFKVFLIASALEESVVSLDQLMYCENGAYRIYDRLISDFKPFGFLTVEEVLIHSSNICAGKIATAMGAERFYDYIRAFGFGEKTMIDLPGENPGLVRPPSDWYPVDLFTIGFGQGIGVTPVQLITSFNAVINGGYLLKPFIVKKILDPMGRVIKTTQRFFRKKVIDEKISRDMRDVLRRVVEEGTGKNARIAGFEVGGKTGTAQKYSKEKKEYSNEKYYSLFIGFAPVRYPRFSGLILIDEPQEEIYGGTVAAPVFRRVLAYILHEYNINPDISISQNIKENEVE